jgi:hypothetical protein
MDEWHALWYVIRYETLEFTGPLNAETEKYLSALDARYSQNMGRLSKEMLNDLCKKGCNRHLLLASMEVLISPNIRMPKAAILSDKIRDIAKVKRDLRFVLFDPKSRFTSQRLDEYRNAYKCIMEDFLQEANNFVEQSKMVDEKMGKSDWLKNKTILVMGNHIREHAGKIPWLKLYGVLEELGCDQGSLGRLKRLYFKAIHQEL